MRRVLLFILIAGIAVAAAGLSIPTSAASVNGVSISTSALNGDLSAISGSPAFQCYLASELTSAGQSSAGVIPVHGAHTGTTSVGAVYNAAFVRFWLRNLVQADLISQMLTKAHKIVTANALTIGSQEFKKAMAGAVQSAGSSSPPACIAASSTPNQSWVPQGFANVQAKDEASLLLLTLPKGGHLTEGYLKAYFFAHQSTFDQVCIDEALFTTLAAAQAAHRQVITTGKPFAAVGNITPYGCANRSVVEQVIGPSAANLAVGQPSTPASTPQTQKAALFEVSSVKPASFTKVTAAEASAQSGYRKVEGQIQTAIASAHITVDPQYGTVAPRTLSVLPPLAPPPATLLNPLADTPASVTSSVSAASVPQLAPTQGAVPPR